MVDAPASGAGDRKVVEVRVFSQAPIFLSVGTIMSKSPKIHFHKQDLPANVDLGTEIAVDCEMMGLHLMRDRLCLVQLRGRDTDIHVVQIVQGQKTAPNLQKLLEDKARQKFFHYARIDIASLKQWLGINVTNVYCTKIASKLARTYVDRHGLKEVVRDFAGVEINKQQANTNWGADELTQEQIDYAASDVLYLHTIKDALHEMLKTSGRTHLAQGCFDFLPTRAALDLAGWLETDIFAHQ